MKAAHIGRKVSSQKLLKMGREGGGWSWALIVGALHELGSRYNSATMLHARLLNWEG
jgi:hypothetical protein